MAFLLPIFAAAASLALPRREASPAWSLVLLVLLVLPHGLAALARGAARRGAFRRATALDRMVQILPVGVQALAWGLLGWSGVLRAAGLPGGDVGDWPGPELLLSLAPFLLATLASIDATARLHGGGVGVVRALRSFQLRMFAAGLAPIAAYLAISGFVGLSEGLRIELEEVSLSSAGFTLLLLLAAVFLLPRLLAALWSTAPLPEGPLRAMLEELGRRAGFRARNLLVWRTGGQIANAAIVGFTPRSRVVLFTDSLLDRLDAVELAAVFGHEVGHARRRHALVFGAWAIGLFLLAETLAEEVATEDAELQLVIFGGTLALWALSFRALSRRAELEADLESLALVGTSAPLVRALAKVTPARSLHRDSWRHLSTEKRARFLHTVEADPEEGEALRRVLRRWSRLAAVVLAAGLVLHGAALGRRWQGERLSVDLRLGRYAQAAARFDALGEPERARLDSRLVERVRLAGELAAEAPSPEELERAARAAFAAGRDRRAALLLELAALRGRTDLEALVGALQVGLDPGEGAAVPQPWREALQQRFGPGN